MIGYVLAALLGLTMNRHGLRYWHYFSRRAFEPASDMRVLTDEPDIEREPMDDATRGVSGREVGCGRNAGKLPQLLHIWLGNPYGRFGRWTKRGSVKASPC